MLVPTGAVGGNYLASVPHFATLWNGWNRFTYVNLKIKNLSHYFTVCKECQLPITHFILIKFLHWKFEFLMLLSRIKELALLVRKLPICISHLK